MLAVKLFLWTLVVALFLQGFLNAESYGSAPTMLGGMGLTMAVMKESLFATNWIGIPRIFVQVAIKETQRHPGTIKIPVIQKRIAVLQRSLQGLREADLLWSLDYSELVSAILADDTALYLWKPVVDLKYILADEVKQLQSDEMSTCSIWVTERCNYLRGRIIIKRRELADATAAAKPWLDLLDFKRIRADEIFSNLTDFYRSLKSLHNVTGPTDPRINRLKPYSDESWTSRIQTTLMMGDLWDACLYYVMQQDSRVHRLLVSAGYQEMRNTHERIQNMSLSDLTEAQKKIAVVWFDEAVSWSWWVSEEMPALVKRCVNQNRGDCTLIGPTEISSLMARMAVGRQIAEDWSRCVLIGLWNGMPVVAILFVLELILIFVGGCTRSQRQIEYQPPGYQPPGYQPKEPERIELVQQPKFQTRLLE